MTTFKNVEIMDVYSGELEILLPNEIQWQVIQAGEFFEVPANAKFGIKFQ